MWEGFVCFGNIIYFFDVLKGKYNFYCYFIVSSFIVFVFLIFLVILELYELCGWNGEGKYFKI